MGRWGNLAAVVGSVTHLAKYADRLVTERARVVSGLYSVPSADDPGRSAPVSPGAPRPRVRGR